jgi:stage V sporulation protein S
MSIEPQFFLIYNALNIHLAKQDEKTLRLAGGPTKSIYCLEVTMDMIKVSATSRTSAVAGAIAGVVREHHRAEVQAIGAGAVNQAVKALVLATGYLRNDGINVSCVPEFADVTIEDKIRTAIKLVVEPQE